MVSEVCRCVYDLLKYNEAYFETFMENGSMEKAI